MPSLEGLDPFSDPGAWDTCKVGGEICPGIVAPKGVTGFERETEWEIKKGKGVQGGTSTLTQMPPAKGSIKFLLWAKEHFDEWDATFRAKFMYDPTKKTVSAVDVFYPSLAKLKITSLVTDKIGPETPEGLGLWSITVDLHEYTPVPPKSITSTPSGSKSNTNKAGASGKTDDPIADAQQAEIKRLMKLADP